MDYLIPLMEMEASREEINHHIGWRCGGNGTAVSGETQVLGDSVATLRPRGWVRETPMLQRMMEGEDVEPFLTTFERVK